ncbi:MAG: hypothetical protein Q9227_004818 [Pyrenula ochraceoflavens]
MAVGVGDLAFCIVRLIKLYDLTFADPTWDAAIALLWSNIELNVAILCTCIPTLAPLLPRSWGERAQHNSIRLRNTSNFGSGGDGSLDYVRRGRKGNVWEDDGDELVGTAALYGGIMRTTDVSIQIKPDDSPGEIRSKVHSDYFNSIV